MALQLYLLAFLLCLTSNDVRSLQMERLANNSTATAKQFPYQVFIELHSNFVWQPVCSGVIISARTILTAAHCFELELGFDAVKIYFGAVNRTDIIEPGQQRLIVKRSNIIVHPEWDHKQNINDIALIKLPADLQFNEYIQPAQLPVSNETYINQRAVLTAWRGIEGNIQDQANTDKLQYFWSVILSTAECKKYYHIYMPGAFFSSSYICLSPKDGISCPGLTSGPLVVGKGNETRILVGLAAFGFEKDSGTQFPIIFTRVSSFLNWITKVDNL